MAEKELDATWIDSFVDTAGNADWTGKFAVMVEDTEKVLSLWEAINEKAQEFQKSTASANYALKPLLEAEIAKNKLKFEYDFHI